MNQRPIALSVNLNKVALVRNSRRLNIPSVTRAAILCMDAGAQGVTVHPRPDERHIRPSDIMELTAVLRTFAKAELNIEGNPFHNLMPYLREYRPQQCTFVPDSPEQMTSDHGWDLSSEQKPLREAIAEARDLGIRVSLFMDPKPEAMVKAKQLGADRVELYTERYARAWGSARQPETLREYYQAAQAALDAGLGVNAGHDLSRENLPDFVRTVPGLLEVSIGHAFISDALELGYSMTVRSYVACLR